MFSINRSNIMQARIRRLFPLLLTSTAFGLIQPLQAATLATPEREMLLQQAGRNGGLMSVMATLEEFNLDAISSLGSTSIRAATEKTASVLRAQLGGEALDAGYWNNGMGQIGLLVTANGLRLLEQSALVKDIQPDVTRSLRDRAWMSARDQRSIEAALNANDRADVEVVLNSEIGYQLGERGETLYRADGTAAQAQAKAIAALQATSFGKGLQLLEEDKARSGLSAVMRARIDRAAYYGLRMAPEVRALRLPSSVPGSSWPQDALDAAAKHGQAEVVISLHGGESYSPNEGYMSAAAWKIQSQAHQEAFNRILADIGAGKDAQVYPGVGTVSVRLSNSSLQALYARKDARVRAVEVSKPYAIPALLNSMPLINMPPAWAAGYRGAGQKIAILDTGVRSDHLFFHNQVGGSRVVKEACFGTNTYGGLYKSICPSQNSSGDSPVGLANSAKPYNSINSVYCNSYASKCAHGTHVAGIAAGRKAAFLPNGIQGVAPDASIFAIQIFSFPVSGSGLPSAETPDVIAALQAVRAETVAGIQNPLIVNMSISGQPYSNSIECEAAESTRSTIISNLNSLGVPVVAATGNNNLTSEITAPACISKVIKVSAVKNDGIGQVRASYANIIAPGVFDTPIFMAPGGEWNAVQIKSADSKGISDMLETYGTSMATPHVSGYYAAIKGSDPLASVADVTAWISSPSGSIAVNVVLPSGTHVFRRIRTSF